MFWPLSDLIPVCSTISAISDPTCSFRSQLLLWNFTPVLCSVCCSSPDIRQHCQIHFYLQGVSQPGGVLVKQLCHITMKWLRHENACAITYQTFRYLVSPNVQYVRQLSVSPIKQDGMYWTMALSIQERNIWKSFYIMICVSLCIYVLV